jgi:hypothetical protein
MDGWMGVKAVLRDSLAQCKKISAENSINRFIPLRLALKHVLTNNTLGCNLIFER